MEQQTLSAPAAWLSGRQTQPVTVVVVDDHPVYRDGLARAISERPDLRLVGEAGDGAEAATLIAAEQPDVALLDVRMPRLDGIDLCAELCSGPDRSRTRVVLLSAFVGRAVVSRAVAAGAAGYIEKDASRHDICEAVARVARGGTAFSDRAGAGVVDALERSLAGRTRT